MGMDRSARPSATLRGDRAEVGALEVDPGADLLRFGKSDSLRKEDDRENDENSDENSASDVHGDSFCLVGRV